MGNGEGSTAKNFIVYTDYLNIVRVVKSRRLRWEGRVDRMEEGRSDFQNFNW